MTRLGGIALTALLALGCVLVGGMIGALLAGELGLRLGAVAGLIIGMQLTLRYLLDQHDIGQAEKNAARYLADRDAITAANRADIEAAEYALVSRRSGLASLLRRRRRLSDYQRGTQFDNERGRFVGRLSGHGGQFHDLELPRASGKRKGKPKRQRFS